MPEIQRPLYAARHHAVHHGIPCPALETSVFANLWVDCDLPLACSVPGVQYYPLVEVVACVDMYSTT